MAKIKKILENTKGYYSTNLIFEGYRLCGQYSENQITAALKALVAHADLEPDEILDSYCRKNAKIYKPHLEIMRSGNPFSISCGHNPYFIASVIEK